ncbi:MAG: CBS domain-containing protein [Chloroflexi bacterium]|nr:CBS domain-containing protein [Chloroflexota bacterium]
MTKLRDIMRPGFVVTVQRGASIVEAAHAMTDRNVGMVAVLEGHRLAGLVSERDVVRRVVNAGHDPAAMTVDEIMTTDIVTASPDEDYRSAVQLMDSANIRHLPICEDGVILSMLSIRDLLRVELRARHEEIRYLHEYMFHTPAETLHV